MKFAALMVALAGIASGAFAAVSFTGTTYTQNFDTLPTGATEAAVVGGWVDDSSLTGWFSNQTALFRVSIGSSSNGSLYSFGSASSTERALGAVGGGSGAAGTGTPFNAVTYALVLVNDTGSTLTSFDLGFDGEQWRMGNNATAHKIDFSYQTFTGSLPAGFVTATGYTDVNALDFTGPQATATTAVALDGNLAANRVANINASVPLTWAAGDSLVLRWVDANDASNDHGLAIDNVSFNAVPTPGAVALLGLAGLVAGRRKR